MDPSKDTKEKRFNQEIIKIRESLRLHQEELKNIAKYSKASSEINKDILETLSETKRVLENKTLEVNEKRGLTSTIFITLFAICFLAFTIGLVDKLDFNTYMATGVIGFVLVCFIMFGYYIND